jgi:hypothetical protein
MAVAKRRHGHGSQLQIQVQAWKKKIAYLIRYKHIQVPLSLLGAVVVHLGGGITIVYCQANTLGSHSRDSSRAF